MNDNRLRMVLRSNAVFSLITGAVLIFAHANLAALFGIIETTYFKIVGGGLISFALYVFYISSTLHLTAIKCIIWGDWAWVAGSLVLLLLDLFDISMEGKIITLVVSMAVATFAILQMKFSKVTQFNFRFLESDPKK